MGRGARGAGGPRPGSLGSARRPRRRRTEEERQRREDERMRREFIRQEHLRRKQLKLMEDMDAVLRPRPPAAKQKKQRPKSIHRDHVESPKTPVKGPPGSPRSGGVCTGTAAGRPARRARGAPREAPAPRVSRGSSHDGRDARVLPVALAFGRADVGATPPLSARVPSSWTPREITERPHSYSKTKGK